MLNDRALLRAHVGALFTQDSTGHLLEVNEPGGKPAPRFFLGRTTQGIEWWFRADLPDGLVKGLTAICSTVPARMDVDEPGPMAKPFVALLEQSAPVQKIWTGPAFRFPDHIAPSPSAVPITAANADLLRPHLGAWCDDIAPGQTLYGVVIAGAAVSVCGSARQAAGAEEAGVETAPTFRGKGYAVLAVRAWANAVRREDRTPLYSTSWTNAASVALARKLALVQFASDLHIT